MQSHHLGESRDAVLESVAFTHGDVLINHLPKMEVCALWLLRGTYDQQQSAAYGEVARDRNRDSDGDRGRGIDSDSSSARGRDSDSDRGSIRDRQQ